MLYVHDNYCFSSVVSISTMDVKGQSMGHFKKKSSFKCNVLKTKSVFTGLRSPHLRDPVDTVKRDNFNMFKRDVEKEKVENSSKSQTASNLIQLFESSTRSCDTLPSKNGINKPIVSPKPRTIKETIGSTTHGKNVSDSKKETSSRDPPSESVLDRIKQFSENARNSSSSQASNSSQASEKLSGKKPPKPLPKTSKTFLKSSEKVKDSCPIAEKPAVCLQRQVALSEGKT